MGERNSFFLKMKIFYYDSTYISDLHDEYIHVNLI